MVQSGCMWARTRKQMTRAVTGSGRTGDGGCTRYSHTLVFHTTQQVLQISAFSFIARCSLDSARVSAVAHATTYCVLRTRTANCWCLVGAFCELQHTSPSTMTLDAMPPDMLFLIMR